MTRSGISFLFSLFVLKATCLHQEAGTVPEGRSFLQQRSFAHSELNHRSALHRQVHRRVRSMTIASSDEAPSEEAAVLIHYVNGFFGPMKADAFKCEIPCRQTSSPGPDEARADVLVSFPMESSPRRNSRNAVSIGHSMESLRLYGGDYASKYDATATMNLRSTLPWTYFDWQSFSRLQDQRKQQPQQFPGFHDRQPKAVFVARNCGGQSRNMLLSALAQAGVPIDSISGCTPQGTSAVGWPKDVPTSDKTGAVKKYRVYMALENVMELGYVTEKIMDGYNAGSVNVYLGAPDVTDYVPSDSYIDASRAIAADGTINREGLQSLAVKIKAALDDESTWTNYFTALNKPMSTWNAGNYEKKWRWSKQPVGGQCRMCRLAFATRAKGARFNTTTQQVEGVMPPPVGHPFWTSTWKSSDAQIEVPH